MSGASPIHLDLWDYISLSSLVALSSIIGLYHIVAARRSKATKDFLVTSNELGIGPLVMSTIATFMSAIGILGLPVEFYMNGLSFSLMPIGTLLVIPLGCFLYLPVLYKLNRNTIFEYLELRFSKSLRTCASVIITLQMLFYTSCVVYAPALALNQVTGLHLWASVVSIGIVCIIYTSLGGIKAVVWADVTQYITMLAVILTILIRAAIVVGGSNVVWKRLIDGKRDQILIVTSSPYSEYSFWTTSIGHMVHLLPVITLNQSLMQRYLSNKTLKKAQISYTIGAIGIAMGQILTTATAVFMFAYYYNCDPLMTGKIKLRDQLMALFAMETLSFCKGLPGVFVAGIMCATLSTLSSSLNSLSAITLNDYIKLWKPDLSNERSMKISKYLVVAYGAICMALVALAENLGGIMKAVFGINSIAGGPMLVVFTSGMLLPWVNSKGAMAGFWCSTILPLWSWIGSLVTTRLFSHAPISTEGCSNWTTVVNITTPNGKLSDNSFYAVSSLWYPSWSIIIGLTVALLVSKLTGFQDAKKVNPDLVFSIMRKYTSDKTIMNNIGKKHQTHAELVDEPLMMKTLSEVDS
ncbi:hypothetical protein CHUAL_013657 [Chamberlinius hualienensis]